MHISLKNIFNIGTCTVLYITLGRRVRAPLRVVSESLQCGGNTEEFYNVRDELYYY